MEKQLEQQLEEQISKGNRMEDWRDDEEGEVGINDIGLDVGTKTVVDLYNLPSCDPIHL